MWQHTLVWALLFQLFILFVYLFIFFVVAYIFFINVMWNLHQHGNRKKKTLAKWNCTRAHILSHNKIVAVSSVRCVILYTNLNICLNHYSSGIDNNLHKLRETKIESSVFIASNWHYGIVFKRCERVRMCVCLFMVLAFIRYLITFTTYTKSNCMSTFFCRKLYNKQKW